MAFWACTQRIYHAWNSLKFISKVNGVYRRNYSYVSNERWAEFVTSVQCFTLDCNSLMSSSEGRHVTHWHRYVQHRDELKHCQQLNSRYAVAAWHRAIACRLRQCHIPPLRTVNFTGRITSAMFLLRYLACRSVGYTCRGTVQIWFRESG